MKYQFATTVGLLSLATQLAAGGVLGKQESKQEKAKNDKNYVPSCDESVCKEWNSGYRASEGYGAYVSGSFIYWQMLEEDMDVASSFQFPGFVGDTAVFNAEGKKFNFRYRPGFKIDLGWNTGYDNWDFFTEYTWYHTGNMTTRKSESGAVTGATITGSLLFTPGASSANVGNFASRTLKAKFDFLDLMLGKSYCFGQKLLFRPSFGARGAWIRQHLTTRQFSNQDFFSFTDASGLVITNNAVTTKNRTISWGYGLKGALEADWMLGYGLKFFGIGAADLLYTHYNLYNKTSIQGSNSFGPFSAIFNASEKKVYYVRPHAELELGFNWGIHFYDCEYYFDLTAAYGFQVFWNQNMFLIDNQSPLPKDNLYLQGLRLSALFAF